MAHGIPYVATASVANLRDLEDKVTRAMEIRGARYIHIHVPCPLGWGSAPADTIKLARLAVEIGPLPAVRGRARRGHRRARTIRRQVPVDEYLKLQKRFAHLFGKTPDAATPRADPGDGRPQHRRLRPAATRRRPMDKPFAITLDAGLEPRQQDRLVAHHRGRSTSTACRPATTPARPARTSRAGCIHAESGDYEAAWRALTEDNPLPAIMGRVCYHPCESACNRGKLDEAVGINSVERFLGDEAIKRGWKFAAPATESGQARAGRRRRAVGTVGRLSPAPPRPRA